MKPKRPDRFERMVRKKAFHTPGPKVTYYLDPFDAVDMLRQEHRWKERMVVDMPLYGAQNTEWKQGYTAACQDILDQLKARRK